ncbi:MAG: serine/threonine-protein kinase [Myxococcota bacterium]
MTADGGPTLLGETATGDPSSPGAGARPEAPDLTGHHIGRYVLLGRIGAGGMGVVHAAYDPELDRKVALKLLRPGPRDDAKTSTGRARLLREAQSMAQLQHPNVVAVHDVGQHERRVYLAMEFVDGSTLAEWMQQPHPWRETLEMFRAAGRGLEAAHAQGLVHRDFKPDNVMVDDSGRPRVMDFGLARRDDPSSDGGSGADAVVVESDTRSNPALTMAGAVMGTPAYMAPEQFLGGLADARSDQFAFAAALYEALYGERPFPGNDMATLAYSVCQGELRPPSPNATVPRWLRAVVVRGLSVAPEDRWEDMSAMLTALGQDPTRKRRRWAVLGGVAVVGATAFGAIRLQQARAEHACRDAAEEIGSAWSTANESALGERFADEGVQEAWDETRGWIEGYTTEWSEARQASCEATTIAGTRSAELHALTEQCLAERRISLQGVLEVSATLEGPALYGVLESVARLPPIRQCSDDGWLRRRPPLPDAERSRQAANEVQTLMARATALKNAGRYDEGFAAATDAVVAADVLGWGPLRARARQSQGAAHENRGEYRKAAEDQEHAFHLALQAGDEETAAHAAIRLSAIVGYELRDVEGGLRWSAIAESLLIHLNAEDGFLHATLFNVRGMVHRRGTDYDAALADYQRALEVRTSLLGEDHPDVAQILNNMGVVHRNNEDYAEAEKAYLRSLATRERVLGPNHPNVADTLNNLAVLNYVWDRNDEAIALNERTLEIRERTLGPDHPRLARTLNNLGIIYRKRGDFERALATYERALAIQVDAMGPDDLAVAETLSNICRAHQWAESLEAGAPRCRRALEIRRSHHDRGHALVTGAMVQVVRNLEGRGRWAEAVELQQELVDTLAASKGPEDAAVANARVFLGRLHVSSGAHERGLSELQRALAMVEGRDEAAIVTAAHWWQAQGLWESGSDRERALELARQAKEFYAPGSDSARPERYAEIEAWLTEREG